MKNVVTITLTEEEVTTVKGALFFFARDHERMAKESEDVLQKFKVAPRETEV